MKPRESVDLPVEAFALLLKAAATAIVNHLNGPASQVDLGFLHGQVEELNTLLGKFEILHRAEQGEL